MYLWNGDTIGSHTIKILRGVERENIGAEVEALYEYTKTLTKSESDNAKEDK